MAWVSSYKRFVDFLSYMVLCAPDKFPKEDFLRDDEQMTLEKAFDEVDRGMQFVAQEVSDESLVQQVRGYVDAAREAYKRGEDVKGAHLLQDVQDALKARKRRT